MFRYLVRYEVARVIFKGPGLMFLGLIALVFGPTIAWVLDHWWLFLIGYLALSMIRGAMGARR